MCLAFMIPISLHLTSFFSGNVATFPRYFRNYNTQDILVANPNSICYRRTNANKIRLNYKVNIMVVKCSAPVLASSHIFTGVERSETCSLYKQLVVESLVDGAAPHPSGLAAADVDVLEKDTGVVIGESHVLGSGNLLINVGTGGLVQTLEVFLRHDTPVKDLLLETRNGVVGAAHALDLFTATVGGTGVGHGVTTVAVGDILVNEGTVARDGVVLTVLDGGLGSEDIHTVDLDTGDVLTALVVLGQGGGTSGGGTHTVLVVCELLVI